MATVTALASSVLDNTFDSTQNITNAYTNVSSNTYAQLDTKTRTAANYHVYFTGFDFSSIPSYATINSVVVRFKGRVNSTTYIADAKAYVSKGTTLIGSGTSFKTTTITIYTLTAGGFTRAELDTLRIYLYVNRTSTKNNAGYAYAYGMEVTVDYTVPEATEKVYLKSNGNWLEVSNVYQKVNNQWVQVSKDLGSIIPNKFKLIST